MSGCGIGAISDKPYFFGVRDMRKIIVVASTCLLLTTALDAKAIKRNEATPAAVKALTDCKSIAEPTQRLLCYDAAVNAVETAITGGDLYVVDKTEIRKTRRSLFGLPLPNLGLFGDDADDKNVVREIDDVVASATPGFDGNWTIQVDTGSVWRQTDGYSLAISPKKGTKIRIMRAALGSYKMSVGGDSAIRVKRIR